MSSLEVAARGVDAVVEYLEGHGAITSFVNEGRTQNNLSVVVPSGRRSTVYVKTKRTGDWQTRAERGAPREPVADEHRFWLLVDLAASPAPTFHVVPEWWMENDIHRRHEDFLSRHGGTRPNSPKSTHHGIQLWRVERWRDRWDLLGL